MATIPDNLLNKIKCSECEEYISCPPVFMKNHGNNICGRCEIPRNLKKNIIRNELFEEVASLLIFPCRFATRGCQIQLKWGESKEHEKTCKYNNIVIICCPSLPTGKCTWSGPYSKVLEHFQVEHAELVIKHPYKFTPYENWIVSDMKKLPKVSFKNLLMVAHGYLFVVQFKICFPFGIIWMCVSFLGDSKLSAHFECFVQRKPINRYTGDTIMINQILAEVTTLDEKKSFEFSLLEYSHTVSINLNSIKCTNCYSSFLKIDSDQNKFCCNKWNFVRDEKTLLKRTWYQCKFHDEGCKYVDVNENIYKHQHLLCTFSPVIKCPDCPNSYANKSQESLIDHLKKIHFNQTFSECLDLADVSLDLNETSKARIETKKGIFFCTWSTEYVRDESDSPDEFGTFAYRETKTMFYVEVFSDLPQKEEKNIKLKVIFKNKANRIRYTRTKILCADVNPDNTWFTSFEVKFGFTHSLRIEIVDSNI